MRIEVITSKVLVCDFCFRPQHEAFAMVAGPEDVCICDVCVDRAAEVVAERRAGAQALAAAAQVEG